VKPRKKHPNTVTIYGLAQLALDTFGALTAAEVRALIADDPEGLAPHERYDLTLSRVTAALRSMVLDRSALSVTEDGIARYRLRSASRVHVNM
jgi:hypothetical protein